MKFWLFLEKLDRRWIFLAIGLCVIIPSLININFPTTMTPPAQNLWDAVNNLKETGQPLIIVTDYAPSTSPELQPMTNALIRHAIEKEIPVIIYGGIYPQGFGQAQMGEEEVIESMKGMKMNGDSVIYGEDYVLFPFVPGRLAVIIGICEDIIGTVRVDAYGDSLINIPMMKDIRRLGDCGLLVDISGSSLPRTWMTYAGTRYGVSIGVGTTAVSAAEYYAFLQTGQFVGMLGGMKGAAEYEQLNEANIGIDTRRKATIAMAAQNFVHLFIIVIVVLGNISFFVLKRNKERRFK